MDDVNRSQRSTSVVLVIGIDSGAGLGYPIIQVTWSGRVCSSSTGTAPQILANNRVLRVSCASLAIAQESRREQQDSRDYNLKNNKVLETRSDKNA